MGLTRVPLAISDHGAQLDASAAAQCTWLPSGAPLRQGPAGALLRVGGTRILSVFVVLTGAAADLRRHCCSSLHEFAASFGFLSRSRFFSIDRQHAASDACPIELLAGTGIFQSSSSPMP